MKKSILALGLPCNSLAIAEAVKALPTVYSHGKCDDKREIRKRNKRLRELLRRQKRLDNIKQK